jgi:hypothetical protein
VNKVVLSVKEFDEEKYERLDLERGISDEPPLAR